MSARKRKATVKAVSSSSSSGEASSSQWLSFDKLVERVRIDDEAREKWVDHIAWERKQVTLLRQRLKVQSVDELLQLHPNESLPLSDIIQIGETLLPHFDVTGLDLTHTIDSNFMAMDHVDRAPGISDAEMDDITSRSQFIPPNMHVVTIERLISLLKQPLPSTNDIKQQEEIQSTLVPVIEPRCFVPLLWFARATVDLPYKLEAKNLYLDSLKALACNTTDPNHKLVWKSAIATFSQMKQGIADYVAATSKLASEAKLADQKRAKSNK